jgi:CRP/FNR family transcriptional regulator, anaerobic regulatory protein
MIPIKMESAWKGVADCQNCAVRDMMLFASLTQSDFDNIHSPIDVLAYKRGQSVFFEGAKAGYLYSIRSGRVKLLKTTLDGHARIVAVLNPGDVFGLESLVSDGCANEAVAIESVHVCRIPKSVIKQLSDRSPSLYTAIMERWHQALTDSSNLLSGMSYGSARKRVVNMILKMRLKQDPTQTCLLSRQDMGSLADLKLETVSRVVASLVRDGCLTPLDKVGRLYRIDNEQLLLTDAA